MPSIKYNGIRNDDLYRPSLEKDMIRISKEITPARTLQSWRLNYGENGIAYGTSGLENPSKYDELYL